MHLKSISLKGFKSFPDRTRLEFGPGISVVVGPNGSGKSNVTDAVLWAMGEQSPLAVRGQSMQDVIFGGGRGVQARGAAEVEIVIDNSDGALDLPMSEISILRSLDRAGEGEYRLNGARCRLIDVLETLSDTGLGKEMHSVISQGRVEAIVTSKPRDRRLLIEEAAGLGKHRKRRRRAQLKLERTHDNLDRALDVEREARSRLRPLKRQSEAAELHERLELQVRQTRWELARDDLRARRCELQAAEGSALAARRALAAVEDDLAEVAREREAAEQALGERSEQRDRLARRAYSTRSAAGRIELRCEQTHRAADGLDERIARRETELAALRARAGQEHEELAGMGRVRALVKELAGLQAQRERELELELVELEAVRRRTAGQCVELAAAVSVRRDELVAAERVADASRAGLREAEREIEAKRRQAAAIGAELATVNQFLRARASAPGGTPALSGELDVQEGCELALAAALGGRIDAALVEDSDAASRVLDRAGADGGRALISGSDAMLGAGRTSAPTPPIPGATRLLDLLRGPEPALRVARRLLGDAWLVADMSGLDPAFTGIAVTRTGRAWFGDVGELRQVSEGGAERLLAERNRRDRLIGEADRAVGAEYAARAAAERAEQDVCSAERELESSENALREAGREHSRADEDHRQAIWLIEARRAAPDQGAGALRRAQLEGELAAERRSAERSERERADRDARRLALERQITRDRELAPAARRLVAALEDLGARAQPLVAELDDALRSDREAGETLAVGLRAAATREAEIQTRLRGLGESVTGAAVRAAQMRDRDAETAAELASLSDALGLSPAPAEETLDEDQRRALQGRRERLERRREQLGPVNPLAQQEYSEALEHVEALEAQRTDLETALRELGALIRDTDRQIRETFQETFTAAARNFEALVGDVFPGGRGRLRLVSEDSGPRPVLGGEALEGRIEGPGAEPEPEDGAAQAGGLTADELLGVEIEVTPAGKTMKRLSLLSGGEKSMTAIAFLFSVFLARPCPFYILDEVEAALDDLNIGRFLTLLRRHSDRAQFIVVTHQKRTMEAADCLYGVSMGDDGVSKVISRRLPPEVAGETAAA